MKSTRPPVQGEQPKGGAGDSGAAAEYFRRPDRTVHPNWIVLDDGSVIDGTTGEPVPPLDTGYNSFNVDPAQIQRDLDGIDNGSVIQVTVGALRVLAQRAARVPSTGHSAWLITPHGEKIPIPSHVAAQIKSITYNGDQEVIIQIPSVVLDGDDEPAYFDGEGDDPVSETWTGQVEEPIEDRLQRAFVNGFVEGIRRASYGLPWDHSS